MMKNPLRKIVKPRASLAQLQKTLGYEFNDPSLLERALTHRSAQGQHNERMEFLGDSLLNMFVAENLFTRFEQTAEGQLSRMRSQIVKGETLAIIAKDLQLGQYLFLGPGESKSGGHRRPSILADAIEAIIAAIYLDSSMETAKNWTLNLLKNQLDEIHPKQVTKDAKTRLQEWLQARQYPLPQYQVIDIKGEDHQQRFVISCRVRIFEQDFIAEDMSRRKAEQSVAEVILQHIEQHELT